MSLMGSALGGALAGAGAGAAQIANSYIDAEIQEQKARALAEIQYANAVKLDQYNLSKPRQDALTAAEVEREKKVGAARNETTLAGEIAKAGNVELNKARRANAQADAEAANDTTKKLTLANAGDPKFLKAQWDIAMADPRVKAAYTAAMASAGSSAASAKLAGLQYTQLVDVGAKATQVRALQGQLSKATDQTAREAIQQQITDLGFAGKDPAKFLSLAEKAQDNIAAAMKLLADPTASDEMRAQAKTQIERATELSTKAAALGGVRLEGGPKLTQEQAYAYARDAIARRANPAEVDKMLVGMGFAPLSGAETAGNASTTPAGGRPLMEAAAEGGAGTMTRQEALAERQLRTAADYADRQRQSGEMAKQAQAAFANITPGDRRAAARMRDDPLFEYLTAQQKASVMRTLSGM